ncbi:hypothetical protein [Haloprofundus sp. MHR1]|uniref:hypothetical protein n=1 Tax=Haloprofundus sp. MHR1 TaxID=2572921 RepID=UPI0010BE7720|nr:hypothetical protein [Haloprofundus sp. MHR1]QCJ47243.1 hypothetical protein FCF25_08995 [Haloprofundus sp. MHR1]
MISRRILKKLTVALLVLSLVATPALGAWNYTADEGPNPYYTYDLTKDEHRMEWGTSHGDALTYADDDGKVTTIDGTVNTSGDANRNPYSFTVTDIESDEFTDFPRNGDNVSALDSANWSTSAGATVADTETADSVDALSFSTSGLADGSSEDATFDLTVHNAEITSDENKRFLQVGLDVAQLDGTVDIEVVDANGDKKVATLNGSANASNDGIVADGIGEGWFFQERLGDMPTEGSGDGEFNDIHEVRIVAHDADSDVSISALNIDKMSRYTLGEKQVETSDDEWETETIYEVTESGPISVESLSSLDESFSSAIIHGLTIPVEQRAEDVSSDDVSAEFEVDENNNYPGYYGTATLYVRNGLPDAYDLSFSNVEYRDNQTLGSDRYMAVQYAEDVGNEGFEDIDSSNFADITDSYSEQGETLSVDSTVQSGDNSVLKYELRLNQNEFNTLQQEPSESSGGFWGGGDGGGIFGTIGSWIGSAVAALVGIVAVLRRRASSAVGGE